MSAVHNSTASSLVLDSIDELNSFHSVADSTYMGKDHNALEPLSFSLPIVVTDNWSGQFSSCPVYLETKRLNLIHEAASVGPIAQLM